MAGGNFTANLNSNGLKLNVKNYKLKNNNINLDLYDAASSYENIDYTTSEENINTNLNTNDFDLGESISKASNQLQEIKSTQEEEKPWWDVVFDYAATAVGSVVSGVVDVVENIGDGLIMCGGELASGVASLCGNEDLASEIKKGTQDIVQYDWSEAAYDAAMDALDVDDEIAHGVVHQVGNALGSMAGYAALSLVPGGAAVTAATGFLAAKGSSAEHAFQSGATFEEASVISTVAGAAGALSGAALNKVQGAAKGASSIKDVAKLTAKGMAVSAAEPVVNSVTEYATYGKDMVDENGNLLYDNFGEYYVESGGVLNTVIAGGAGGASTFLKSYNNPIYKARKNTLNKFKNDPDVTDWNSSKEFREKVNKADKVASKYAKEGVMDKKTFYEIWGADKGSKPDPSSYLTQDYIDNHISRFIDGGGSRITAEDDYIRFKHNINGAGNPNSYNVSGTTYQNGSEFISTSDQIDYLLKKANNSSDKVGSICDDLGLGNDEKKKFSHGMMRYDIDASEISKLNPRITNGNEPGAFKLDWIPGGYTLGGSPEIAIDKFKFNGTTIKHTKI